MEVSLDIIDQTMPEKSKRLFRINKPARIQNLSQRAEAANTRAQSLGISTFGRFVEDLTHDKYTGGNVDRVDAVLDLVESKQPGIILEYTNLGDFIFIIEPVGEFTWRGFSGTLLSARFKKSGADAVVSLERLITSDKQEKVIWNRQTIEINPGNYTNTGTYIDRRLRELTYQAYNDSTSSFMLRTEYDEKAGLWKSYYTPAYGGSKERKNELLEQNGLALKYSINEYDSRMIKLISRSLKGFGDNRILTIGIQLSEDDGRIWKTIISAPLSFPDYLLPANNAEEYVTWLEENWTATYPKLQQREPIIRQRISREQ